MIGILLLADYGLGIMCGFLLSEIRQMRAQRKRLEARDGEK